MDPEQPVSEKRRNDMAAYYAAGEALRCTRHRVELTREGNRWRLGIGGHPARVFGRHITDTRPRPLRLGTGQDVTGAHSLIFVDFTEATPRFYITPPDVPLGQIGQWADRWDRFDAAADGTSAAAFPTRTRGPVE